jgi:hypothetical protein
MAEQNGSRLKIPTEERRGLPFASGLETEHLKLRSKSFASGSHLFYKSLMPL